MANRSRRSQNDILLRLTCTLLLALLLIEMRASRLVFVNAASTSSATQTTAIVTTTATATDNDNTNETSNDDDAQPQLPENQHTHDRRLHHHRRHLLLHRRHPHKNRRHHDHVVHKQRRTAAPTQKAALQPLDEETVRQVRMCSVNITTMELCQRCASITKSMTVFPLCCADVDGIQGWCQEYLDYGRV